MALTFIARMKVFPEKIEQFIDSCERMEKAVSENEPNCTKLYGITQFCRH